MSPGPYTHTFRLKIGDLDFGGEIEFNVDGSVSYKTNEPIEGIKLEEYTRIHAFFNELKRIFNQFGTITKIEVETQ